MLAYTLEKNHVMGRVFFGLFLSLMMAFIGVIVGSRLPTGLIGVLMIVELVMIVVAMFVQRRRRMGYGFVLAFTFISGITLYPIIASYTLLMGPQIILKALGVTAVAFLVASIVASRTTLDFSFLGGFLFVGLMVIVLMGVVSLFVGFSTQFSLIYSILGVVIFVGYILYDVNRLVRVGIADADVPWIVLSLYLDFVNLFLFVLRLLGILQDSRR